MYARLWSTRSSLERVDLYTRGSLYGIHLLFMVLVPGSLVSDDVDLATFGALVAAGAAVNLLAALTLRALVSTPGAGAPRRLALGLVAACAVSTGLVFLLPEDLRASGILLVCLAVAFGFGAVRDDRVGAAVVAVCTVLAWVATREVGVMLAGGGYALMFVVTLRASLWVLDVMHELDRARGAQSALAVAEERLRFSRDVHDVLGRQLSTIAVQAELAATLASRGDPTAADRMLDVRATAHQALREARELARGYRASDLDQELEGARSLLRSAGITMTADVDGLPDAWREPAAWMVREATTNVLRHSAATTVDVRYDGSALTLVNDRPNRPAGQVTGSGLTGLRERLEPLGATLATDHAADAFTVVVTLPGDAR